jgi:hypothetical protein
MHIIDPVLVGNLEGVSPLGRLDCTWGSITVNLTYDADWIRLTDSSYGYSSDFINAGNFPIN